jgi:hypothetical protein
VNPVLASAIFVLGLAFGSFRVDIGSPMGSPTEVALTGLSERKASQFALSSSTWMRKSRQVVASTRGRREIVLQFRYRTCAPHRNCKS